MFLEDNYGYSHLMSFHYTIELLSHGLFQDLSTSCYASTILDPNRLFYSSNLISKKSCFYIHHHGRLWRSCLWVDMRDLTLASKKSLIKQLITRTCSCLEMWILLKAVIQLSVHLLTTMARSWMEWHEVDHILRIW